MDDDSEWNYDDDPVWSDRVGPRFKDDIVSLKNEQGYPCEFVNVPFIFIDYRSLERDQFEYYLFWRDNFWSGRMLRTCEGYLWLLCNEIGVLEPDPRKTYQLLMTLWNERRCDLFDPSLFTEFVRDYAIEHNLPQPSDDEFGCDRNEVLVNLISCCPPWYLDLKTLSEMTEGIGIMRSEGENLCRIIDITLRRLDLKLKRKDSSLVQMYSTENLENVHELYQSYALLRGKKLSADSPDLYHNLEFRSLIRDMARYITARMRGLRSYDRPDDLSDVVIDLINDTMDDVDGNSPGYRPTESPIVIRPIPERYIARGLHSRDRDVQPAAETDKVNIMIDRNIRISPLSAPKLIRNWPKDTDRPARYVPSGFVNPSYDTFNDEQYDYYMYWRTQLRKGIYLETDNGYVRFLIAETVSCSDDPNEAVGFMKRVADTYHDRDLTKFIRTTIVEYCVVHGLPIESTEGAYESLLNGIACMYMGTVPMKEMPADVLSSMSGVDLDMFKGLGDEAVKAINQSLIRIDNERVALGMPPTLELFNVKKIAHSAFYTIRRDFPVPSYNSSYQSFVIKNNSSFRSYVLNTIKLVTSYIDKFSGKKVKIKVPKYHGERTLRIIETCVMEAYGLDPRRKKLELDATALKSAKDDLSAVTELMSSDEKEETPKEGPIEEEDESGWDALAKRLDEKQTDYLISAMDDGGRCASIAKSCKMTVSKMEDSINSIAMDCIGDTIVENQSVIADYYDDIRAILPQ